MTSSEPRARTAKASRTVSRRPRGAVRDGLVTAGLELARAGGPDAVVLREATRMVGVVPNAAYRHFADRDELLAAVCTAAMMELADRMAAGVARVKGRYGDPAAAGGRLGAIGTAYLEFARTEPGLFATAYAVPEQHAYGGADRDRTPLGQLRAVLDELVDAGVLSERRREGIEYPIWSTVHGLAVLTGQGPLRDIPDAMRHHLEELTLGFITESLALPPAAAVGRAAMSSGAGFPVRSWRTLETWLKKRKHHCSPGGPASNCSSSGSSCSTGSSTTTTGPCSPPSC